MNPMMKRNPLSDHVRTLCNRVATERTRAATWKEAAQLRKEAQQRLAAGATLDAVAEWLESERVAALASQ